MSFTSHRLGAGMRIAMVWFNKSMLLFNMLFPTSHSTNLQTQVTHHCSAFWNPEPECTVSNAENLTPKINYWSRVLLQVNKYTLQCKTQELEGNAANLCWLSICCLVVPTCRETFPSGKTGSLFPSGCVPLLRQQTRMSCPTCFKMMG